MKFEKRSGDEAETPSSAPDHSVPLQRLHSGQISESLGLQWLQHTYTGAHSFHTGESHD